jgi:hypothetical protein
VLYGSYAGVPFRSLSVDEYGKWLTPTADGTQPVGIHVQFSGTILVSPDHLSKLDFDRADQGLVEPELEGPNLHPPGPPVMSVPELVFHLERRLNVVRKPLLLWGYKPALPGRRPERVYLVRSPAVDQDGRYLPSDMLHGPTPEATYCGFETGQGGLLFSFKVHTDLPLCEDTYRASPIVANTWSMGVSNDDDFFARHVIQGEVICRMDLMRSRKLSIDMLRGWFVHPIPRGFRRVEPSPNLVMLDGGSRYTYTLVDVEQPADQPGVAAYGASRINVVHQREYTKSNPYGII